MTGNGFQGGVAGATGPQWAQENRHGSEREPAANHPSRRGRECPASRARVSSEQRASLGKGVESCLGDWNFDKRYKRGANEMRRGRSRKALLVLAIAATAFLLSLLWEGPRSLYLHAVVICLDCIGLI